MAKFVRKAGATSNILQIFIADSSSTTGAGLTGLVFNTASLTAYYHKDGDTTATAITLVTMTVGTFTSSGFKEIDATNMPGWYQFCPPDAAFSAGKSTAFHLKGATNMAPLPLEVELWAVDPQVATNFGLSAIPTATAGASTGLLISGSNSGTTTLGALTCTGTFTISDGLLVSRSTSNTSAITATGNGTGSGVVATSGSGATGDGIQATAASTNGNGFAHVGTGTGAGFKSTGGATGNGMQIIGGGTSGDALLTSATSGHGATFAGTGTTKHGINAMGGATSSDGIRATGGGTGHGLNLQSGAGATGNGLNAVSNATNGSGATLTKTGTGSDLNATVTPLTLAKTTNITGFNDIAATAIVSSGAITTSGGAVSTVTTVTNQLTAAAIATGVWTDTTAGDFTAANSIGKSVMNGVALGTGLTVNAVTGLTASNLDVAVSSRMATYAQPTGFLAATFPGTVASTTNITAGTITTATNLTNAPTAGDFTATMKTSIGTAVAASAVASVSGNVGGNVVGSVGSVTAAVTLGTVNSSASNIKKNVQLTAFPFIMTDSTTHGPATGLTVSATRSLDGNAFASCANSVTEVANGWYKITLAAADLNANTVALRFTATSADDRDITIVTQP